MDALYNESTIDAVRGVAEDVAALLDLKMIAAGAAMDAWRQAVDTRLLPRLLPHFPLVVAICGGGSSGKSTLFNTLAGKNVSPTGGRAGINRRVLIALSASHRPTAGVADALFEPFGCPPQEMGDARDLTTPGDPLLYFADGLPSGVALADTPDFDTGARGSYQNREMAEQSLRAADVLIYIFTNANYNNRDNTDFIAHMLTAVGIRKCFLVYRTDPGFADAEVREHARTVATNLYGDRAAEHVLGVYRAGEDNRVAIGQRPMTIDPVEGDQPGLMVALMGMDPRQVRGDLHRTIFSDVVEQGDRFLGEAQDSLRHLELYLSGLRMVQRRCVQEALGHLPMDAVVRRFSEIWQATDPSHIRIMRKTGRVIETPIRLLMRAARWVGGGTRRTNGEPGAGETAAAMETDFVRAASRLHQAAANPVLELRLSLADPVDRALVDSARQMPACIGVTETGRDVKTFSLSIPLHPALADTQAALRSRNWSAVIDDMLARQDTLLSLTHQLEAELHRLADEQRARLTTVDQIRQTFSAMLNIIPATAAVTYVLHTGDPVGAVGIKVKLAGLFGLNDLYALVAIPATAGMKKADIKQLETLLGPVAQAWLTHKLTAIEALFENGITGGLLQQGQIVIEKTNGRLSSVAQQLGRCRRALEQLR